MRRSPLVLLALAACHSAAPPPPPDLTVESDGAYATGTVSYQITDATRGRTLTVQAWYPAPADQQATAATGVPIWALDPPNRTRYQDQILCGPRCATETAHVVLDAAAAPGPFPIVLFSHCHACGRLSNETTAERLATHGFVVLAVDHAGDTLWEHYRGVNATLDTAELNVRIADVRAVLDQLAAAPAKVVAAADPGRVGVFGHSFGAVTAGGVAQADARILAAAAIASPMENPLIPGVTIADVHVPTMFIVAIEDNSITEFGNKFIRDNFKAAASPTNKLEVADAGHWSFSDFNGLDRIFPAGCGAGTRQTDGTPFTYLPPTTGRAIAAAYVTAFFEATLLGNDGARSYLEQGAPAGVVTADHH